MSRFWSPVVHALQPYVPGEQPKVELIKLNTNENPYGPSPAVTAALQAAAGGALRRYPDPSAAPLQAAIAELYGLRPSQVFIGNGSDEVLAHAFQALFKHEHPLLFPDVTYSFYPSYCKLYEIDYATVPVDEQLKIQLHDFLRPNGGIIFPNPNAPTGQLLPLAAIETLLQRNTDSVVLVDEAYIDFGGESAAALVNRYPNLLVVQTLSKSRSLAGLRVGFALGSDELIAGLDRVKNSFNSYPIDQLALAGSLAALADHAYFEQTRQMIIASRERLAAALQALGFEVSPSAANFVLTRHPQHDAGQLAAALRQRMILVRHFKLPRIEQYLRITVGTDAECETLIAALTDIVGA